MKFSYVNRKYVPHKIAHIHIEDRGHQFSDGVYEVMSVRGDVVLDLDLHCERLQRSLDALGICYVVELSKFRIIIKELLRRNNCKEGILYIQINRGVAERNHSLPQHTTPTLVMTVKNKLFPKLSSDTIAKGKLISSPDIRWQRCDIKSVSLLANILTKDKADRVAVTDTVMYDSEGFVTECSASNIFMVHNGTLITRPANETILGGITRSIILDIAHHGGIKVEERLFTLEELKKADEVFITSTTKDVLPISVIDNNEIGLDRQIGTITKKLMDYYSQYIRKQIIMEKAA